MYDVIFDSQPMSLHYCVNIIMICIICVIVYSNGSILVVENTGSCTYIKLIHEVCNSNRPWHLIST